MGVQRFIYCSSVSVVVGDQHVINGVESKTTVPNKFLFNGYSSTKLKAETIVLKANCKYLANIKHVNMQIMSGK